MSAKHCCRVKISRLRFNATTLSFLLLVVILITQSIAETQASADYGEPDDFQLSSGSASEAASNNDDFYDPALLQQEVEASEQKTSVEHMEAEAEQPMKDVNNVSANHISAEYMSQEHDNMTEEEAQNEEERGPSEEYEDSSSMNILTTPKTIQLPTSPTTTTTTTTMIPEYVRKAKAEHFRPTMMASEDEVESNDSISDYIEDEGVLAPHQATKKSSTMKSVSAHHDSKEDEVDDIVPFAMKFYQNDDDDEDAQEDNKLKEQEELTAQSLPQLQLLPNLQQAQPFHHQTSSEEEYNEDSRGEGIEHQFRGSGKTTSTPNNPSTTFPTNQPNNIAIARAAIPGFPVKFSGSWTTNSPPTTTATSAATVAPTTTTTGLSESSTTTTAATPTITTLRPAGKQAKQINISRRKLLPHEQLRNYVEDAYIRMPLAVIVDPSAESLEKTKALWRDALRTNLNIKIVLVSLNASGIPAAYNFNNTRQFLAGLNSIKEHAGGNAFIGIVHASELVPYDSAVFISTASIPRHTELVQDAAITLLKKRIRLYLIWYGERAISENETQEAVGGILGEVAIRSGGEILHIVGSENSQELEGNTLTLVADAFRGSQEVEVPVDTTLSSLHVKIDAPMRTATLETPNGDINLKKLVKFKSRVLTFGGDDKRLDAYVPLTKLRKATVFKLKMVPESLDQEYGVFVRADRKADQFLDDMIKRFDSYFMEGLTAYPTKFRDSRLQSITAALAAATQPTHDNLRFPDPDEMATAPKTEVETFSEIEVHKSTNAGNNSVTADVTAAVGNQRATNVLQRDVTKIEMGVQSQVLVAPGMMAQLHFEVTNTRSESIFHNIQVIDERRFLLRLAPQSVFLRAGEMTTVSVTVLVPAGTPEGTVDRITFTCHGGGGSTLSLNLRVITTVDAQDTTAPSISWYFGNRCDNIASDSSSCAERFWTLDITAQDWQTGIMRLMSTPSGLIYRNSYTIGSTDPLKATYIATCCEPKVALTAYDIAGNQRSYNIDVRDIWLTEASIAAIVLGALLLILLIVLLIAGIVWCCRRRKVSLDLPTYRSHSTRSME